MQVIREYCNDKSEYFVCIFHKYINAGPRPGREQQKKEKVQENMRCAVRTPVTSTGVAAKEAEAAEQNVKMGSADQSAPPWRFWNWQPAVREEAAKHGAH